MSRMHGNFNGPGVVMLGWHAVPQSTPTRMSGSVHIPTSDEAVLYFVL